MATLSAGSRQPDFVVPALRRGFQAQIRLPGSKSIALRQLAMAALTDGVTRLSGIPPCDDTGAMLACLTELGAKIYVDGDTIMVTGPINRSAQNVHLDAHMSGASTRLLIGLAALRSGTTLIDGHESLRVRTNAPLFATLREHGCRIDAEGGGLPAQLQGVFTPPPVIEIDGSLSSQYVTALMLIAPYTAQQQSQKIQRIRITGDLVSKPYLDITLNEMSKRGVSGTWEATDCLAIPAGTYAPGDVMIEGDATAATYFTALATLHQANLHLTNLDDTSVQGDQKFNQLLSAMGSKICYQDGTYIRGPNKLEPVYFADMKTMPDAALTLLAMAPLLPFPMRIGGLSSLHHKECDRLECPAAELRSIGYQAHTTSEDSIRFDHASDPNHRNAAVRWTLREHRLNTYHDHRMAMAFSLLGSFTGTLTLDDPSVVKKTYPSYWDDYQRLLNAPNDSEQGR